MTGDKLKALKGLPAPGPSEAARAAALAAAMAAFDAAAKNTAGETQESAAPGRLTLASTQTQRSRLMRANYFHYKIAASIAVMIVAVPVALHMWRQEAQNMPASLPLAHNEGPVAGTTVPAAAGKPGMPAGDSKDYERLTPDGRTQAASSTPAAASPSFTAPAPAGSSLEERIDEALKKAQGSAGTPSGWPPMVRSEYYRPDGTRVDARPVITPSISNVDSGLPYPFANTAPAPAERTLPRQPPSPRR